MKQNNSFTSWKKQMLLNPAIKDEYDTLQPEMAVIRAVILARIKKQLTQQELAKRMGTKQSVISRLESGRSNPSIAFLKKLAEALDTKLQIKLVKV